MSSPLPPDPYKSLGVPKDAELTAIRSAHRKLVLKCHPDKFPDPTLKAAKAEEFHQVQQAYELLSDETRRQRYDEHIKLVERRAELMKDMADSRRTSHDSAPPPKPTASKYDARGPTVYEERIPRRPHAEDYLTAKHDDGYRSPSKKGDEYYEFAKKSSTRLTEEIRKERAYDEERARRKAREQAAKAELRSVQADRKKARDKDRRQEHEAKHYAARANQPSDSESDYAERYENRRPPEPRRKSDEDRGVRRDHRRRKSRDDDQSDYSEERSHHEHSNKQTSRVSSAVDYMVKIASAVKPIEADTRRRPPPTRTASGRPQSPPPHLAAHTVDAVRRPSAQRVRSSREAGTPPRPSEKDRRERLPDIFEPPEPPKARRDFDSGRRPAMQSAASAPVNLHIPPPPPPPPPPPAARSGHGSRSSNWSGRSDEKPPAPLGRSQTSPLTHMASPVHTPLKSSKLRASEPTHDSGYSSPEKGPYTTSTRYQVEYDDDSDSDDLRPAAGPRIISVDPERRRSDRDVSPRDRGRQYSERPSMAPRMSTRTVQRSQPFSESPATSRAPTSSRSAAVRDSPREKESLFGEFRGPSYNNGNGNGNGNGNYKVQYSPRIEESDIRWSNRRGGGVEASPRDARDHREKDAYAYDERRRARSPPPSHGHPPGLGVRGPSYMSARV